MFSPHTRGCSSGWSSPPAGASVFPAYAGMFRQSTACPTMGVCFPRIRGDVPFSESVRETIREFSPHTRGCSDARIPVLTDDAIFPAYAGMFRRTLGADRKDAGFPRIRGDVPDATRPFSVSSTFSPHTRGCSGVPNTKDTMKWVFPAYAGMFPKSQPPCLPKPFSPHTRGYSRGKACNEEDSSEKNLVNKEAYSASRLSALVTA